MAERRVFYDPTNLVVASLSGVMSGPDFLPPTPHVSDFSEGQSGAVSEGWQYETLSFSMRPFHSYSVGLL